MQLSIASLNSGSNGNCYYIGNQREAILVDAGISCRETERRLKRLGLDIYKVRAIFVTHEHSDHIKGIAVLSKKFNIPVYITEKTRLGGRVLINDTLIRTFSHAEVIRVGELEVEAFSKFHDAAEPHSFVVSHHETRVGVFTDIGRPCDNLVKHFEDCDAVFLEANYDEEMLELSSYPYFLKQRIRGGYGHLSNRQALDLLLRYRAPYLSLVLLSHLSANNNCPDKLMELFSPHAGDTSICVASRYRESPVFQVSRSEARASLWAGGGQVCLEF